MAGKKAPKKAAPKKATPKKAAPKKAAPKKAAPVKAVPKKASPKKATAVKAVPKKAAPKKAAPVKAVPKKAAPAPVAREVRPQVPVPTTGAVLGALFARDVASLVQALSVVDFERMARYLLGFDWTSGHWSRFDWSLVASRLDESVLGASRQGIVDAHASSDVRKLARALRTLDWKKLLATAPLDEMLWFGQVLELVVSLYNHEKTEILCPACTYPYRDVFGRLFHMEREITGRIPPLVCPYEGDGQHCPPDLQADSWTRLDDLTGQDGRSVRTAGLADRCVTAAKIAFDLSQVPEGGGCVAMLEEERERLHKQHAGRVGAEPASSDGELVVTLAGFRATDEVQVVASGFYTEGEGPRRPMVVEWELNHMNSEMTLRCFDHEGNALTGEDHFLTVDWIATTR